MENTPEYTAISDQEIAELLKQNESGELSGFSFSEINFTDFSLRAALIIESRFIRCNLANLDLTNANFRSVKFEACNLMGINWTKLKRISELTFYSCKLDYGSFQSLQLRSSSFIDCSLKEADFSDADISKVDFSNSQLAGTSFARANLEKADLRTAKNYFIDPKLTRSRHLVRGARR
jgi:fluoroquinolone resistance protein